MAKRVPMLAAAAVTILALLAAKPKAAAPSHYGVEVLIAPRSDNPAAYNCTATLKDLATGTVIGSPKITTLAGTSGHLIDNGPDGLNYDFQFQVSRSGDTATYSIDVTDIDRIRLASSSGTVVLRRS